MPPAGLPTWLLSPWLDGLRTQTAWSGLACLPADIGSQRHALVCQAGSTWPLTKELHNSARPLSDLHQTMRCEPAARPILNLYRTPVTMDGLFQALWRQPSTTCAGGMILPTATLSNEAATQSLTSPLPGTVALPLIKRRIQLCFAK